MARPAESGRAIHRGVVYVTKRRSLALSAATLALLLIGVPAPAATTAPQLGAAMPAKPLPLPYRPSADAAADIDAALKRAARSGKRVLIDFGANWCPDCRVFAGVVTMPAAQPFIRSHCELVLVDVGRMDHNMDLSARFGAAHPIGIPTILVVTPEGRLLNGDNEGALSNARSMAPQAIVDWLARWVRA